MLIFRRREQGAPVIARLARDTKRGRTHKSADHVVAALHASARQEALVAVVINELQRVQLVVRAHGNDQPPPGCVEAQPVRAYLLADKIGMIIASRSCGLPDRFCVLSGLSLPQFFLGRAVRGRDVLRE
jgi:hypothetical protein